jgi:acetylornithine deacetylase
VSGSSLVEDLHGSPGAPAIFRAVTALPSAVELVRALVAEPSVSSPDPRHDRSNRSVIDRLASWCEHVGFRVDVSPLPNAPHKANLVATLGDGPDGLVLAGHTDTVPYDESGWATASSSGSARPT